MTEPVPIACSLTTAEAADQMAEWGSLRAAFARSTPIQGGMRMWFDRSVEEDLRAVAAREAQCCPFLTLEVAGDGDLVRLDLTSDQEEAQPVIEGLTRSACGTGCC